MGNLSLLPSSSKVDDENDRRSYEEVVHHTVIHKHYIVKHNEDPFEVQEVDQDEVVRVIREEVEREARKEVVRTVVRWVVGGVLVLLGGILTRVMGWFTEIEEPK